MTVYEPGGACLTRVQHDQRELTKQLQQRAGSAPAAQVGNQRTPVGKPQTQQAVQPASDAEKILAPTSSTQGQFLDIVV